MVNVAWVLDRADSLAAAGQYLQAMFGLGAGGWDDLTALYLRENWTVLAASVLFAGPLAPRLRNWAAKKDSPCWGALPTGTRNSPSSASSPCPCSSPWG